MVDPVFGRHCNENCHCVLYTVYTVGHSISCPVLKVHFYRAHIRLLEYLLVGTGTVANISNFHCTTLLLCFHCNGHEYKYSLYSGHVIRHLPLPLPLQTTAALPFITTSLGASLASLPTAPFNVFQYWVRRWPETPHKEPQHREDVQ